MNGGEGHTGEEIHTHSSCCTSLLVLRMMSSLTGEGRRDLGDSSACGSSVKLDTVSHIVTGTTGSDLQNKGVTFNGVHMMFGGPHVNASMFKPT